MNLPTVLLLASLLCAESPAGTKLERFMMVQAIIFRAEVKGMSIEEVVYAPYQFAGIHTIDLEGYRLYRPKELQENIQIAMWALANPPVMQVSNFARTNTCNIDKPCEWEQRCQVILEEGIHTFYVCDEWLR